MSIDQAVTCIYNRQGSAVGMGFLVEPGRVLTCAHVVSSALGLPAGEFSTQEVTLSFPLIPNPRPLTARVVFWKGSEEEDLALLELAGSPGSLPPGAQPLTLLRTADLWGHAFRAFGFPRGDPLGAWASGLIRSATSGGRVQVEADRATGYAIQPGFSGAPVWDEQLEGAVGMVALAETNPAVKAAFIIPTAEILRLCPGLDHATHLPLQPLAAPGQAVGSLPDPQPGEQIKLHEVSYLPRKILYRRAVGEWSLCAFRATNLTMTRDVGILQVSSQNMEREDRERFELIQARAAAYAQVSTHTTHLPHAEDIAPRGPDAFCIVTEWIYGSSLEQLFPGGPDAPLPDRAGLLRLVNHALELCEALAELHKARLASNGIAAANVIFREKRGVVLVDPLFAAPAGVSAPVLLNPSRSADTAADIRQLATMLFTLCTHTAHWDQTASQHNPAVPHLLDALLHDGISGALGSIYPFRRGLQETRRLLRQGQDAE